MGMASIDASRQHSLDPQHRPDGIMTHSTLITAAAAAVENILYAERYRTLATACRASKAGRIPQHMAGSIRAISFAAGLENYSTHTVLESGAFNVFNSAAIGPAQWVVPALLTCAAMYEGAG
jgi:hypothetical protein